MSKLPCPEGFCVVPDCGKVLRASTCVDICDGHWTLVPLDVKRLLMKFGKSSARSAAHRKSLDYRRALQLALDAIAEKAKGYTDSMSRTITDRDLSTK